MYIFFLEVGKQQFLAAGGLECLREFSYKPLFDGKGWDRLLYRACTVLCKVCEAKALPVDVEMCPTKYNIPDGHLILPEGKKPPAHIRTEFFLKKLLVFF